MIFSGRSSEKILLNSTFDHVKIVELIDIFNLQKYEKAKPIISYHFISVFMFLK